MRLLVVAPGASFSTKDVYDGLVGGLKRAGAEVIQHNLENRLDVCARALKCAYRKYGKAQGLPSPTYADVIYFASQAVLEKALRFQTPWVIVISGGFFHAEAFTLLRRAGIKTSILLTESPYDSANELRAIEKVDLAWTNERSSLGEYRAHNPNTHYLAHAYDPARHRVTPAAEEEAETPAHDVVFVGTGWQERIETLEAVDWEGIDFGLYGNWGHVHSRSPLRRYLQEGNVPNQITAALYRKAKIGLNLYRTSVGYGRKSARIASAESMNPRALELAACGTFSVSDYREELAEVFGELVPTFREPRELGPLLRRWLADDPGRQEIARRLPAAVAPRSFDAMAAQVLRQLAEADSQIRLPTLIGAG